MLSSPCYPRRLLTLRRESSEDSDRYPYSALVAGAELSTFASAEGDPGGSQTRVSSPGLRDHPLGDCHSEQSRTGGIGPTPPGLARAGRGSATRPTGPDHSRHCLRGCGSARQLSPRPGRPHSGRFRQNLGGCSPHAGSAHHRFRADPDDSLKASLFIAVEAH